MRDDGGDTKKEGESHGDTGGGKDREREGVFQGRECYCIII
jgi:hypothetical protein